MIDKCLDTPMILKDIEEIKTFEQKAAMSMASPSVLWEKRKEIIDVGVPKGMLYNSIARNLAKRVL